MNFCEFEDDVDIFGILMRFIRTWNLFYSKQNGCLGVHNKWY